MPTRTQTSKRPSGGRFGRPAGKPARPARHRRPASSRRPAMATRRRPEKSGVAKAAEKLGGLIPGGGGQKPTRGAAGGRSKRGTAGRLALLAGAAGLAVKNRDKLMSMIRGGDSSHEASHPVEPQPLPSTPAAPETNTAGTPLSSTDHPPA